MTRRTMCHTRLAHRLHHVMFVRAIVLSPLSVVRCRPLAGLRRPAAAALRRTLRRILRRRVASPSGTAAAWSRRRSRAAAAGSRRGEPRGHGISEPVGTDAHQRGRGLPATLRTAPGVRDAEARRRRDHRGSWTPASTWNTRRLPETRTGRSPRCSPTGAVDETARPEGGALFPRHGGSPASPRGGADRLRPSRHHGVAWGGGYRRVRPHPWVKATASTGRWRVESLAAIRCSRKRRDSSRSSRGGDRDRKVGHPEPEPGYTTA